MTSGQDWAALVSVPEAERPERMVAMLEETLRLDEGERIAALTDFVRAEYELADDELRAFTASRLRAWLRIASRRLEDAQILAHAYDAIFQGLPGPMAMRRASMVQTAVRDFEAEAIEDLFLLVPSLIQQVPRARASILHAATPAPPPPVRSPARRWWRFWAR